MAVDKLGVRVRVDPNRTQVSRDKASRSTNSSTTDSDFPLETFQSPVEPSPRVL